MHHRYYAVLIAVAVLAAGAARARAAEPVVRAVLFYSPTCPHCQQVITQDLPPLVQQYGERLDVLMVDTTQAGGLDLYKAALVAFNVPSVRRGVPMLIVGTTVLVGADEIPRQFPGLIERSLARGGVDWPEIPGLESWIPAERRMPVETVDIGANLARDPAGSVLAIAVLAVLVGVVAGVAVSLRQPAAAPPAGWRRWAILALSVLGLGVAAYLTYVEATQAQAFCGPIGDCKAVQQSQYARLFGVLSVGVMGVTGYVAVLAAWIVARLSRGALGNWAALALFGMTVFGTLFSIYLTFLEPFVIGAVCIWCLSSAVIMGALLWLTAPQGRSALSTLFPRAAGSRRRSAVRRA